MERQVSWKDGFGELGGREAVARQVCGGRELLRERYLALPAGERYLLGTLKEVLRSAKGSRVPEVARAARKWELRLGCFVRVRVANERRGKSAGKLRVEG